MNPLDAEILVGRLIAWWLMGFILWIYGWAVLAITLRWAIEVLAPRLIWALC